MRYASCFCSETKKPIRITFKKKPKIQEEGEEGEEEDDEEEEEEEGEGTEETTAVRHCISVITLFIIIVGILCCMAPLSRVYTRRHGVSLIILVNKSINHCGHRVALFRV